MGLGLYDIEIIDHSLRVVCVHVQCEIIAVM